MYRSRTRHIIPLLALVAVVVLAVAPFASDDSSAAAKPVGDTDILYVYDEATVSVSAGSSTTLIFYLNNQYDETKVVYVSATSDNNDIKVSTDTAPMTLRSTIRDSEVLPTKVTLDIEAGHYAHQGDYSIEVGIKAMDTTVASGSAEGAEYDGSFTVSLNVSSDLTASQNYNKYLGYFANDAEGVMGEAWFTALVSFFIYMAIGYLVMFIAIPIILRIVMHKDDPDKDKMKKILYRMCQIIIFIWAVGQCLRILGTDEEIIDIVNRIFEICYIIVGVMLAWQLYKVVVDIIIRHISSKDMPGKDPDFEGLRPLFLYLGEIVLAIILVMTVMSLLGFDLAAIITSAGLVSLGISMGAKDVLAQFFSGLVILATRPFKQGDLICVGNDPMVYRVRKVNIMNTVLENWDNTDVNIMPNSTLETSKIQNITGETLVYKTYISMDVGYGTDLAKVRQIMQDVASKNPHVITDGSVTRPYTRVESFGDNNVEVKMGLYLDDFNASYTIRGQIRQALYNAFNEQGIPIDYPQIVIHQVQPEKIPTKSDGPNDGSASQW